MKIKPILIKRLIFTFFLLIIFGNAVVLMLIPLSEFTWKLVLSNCLYSVVIGGSMGIGITQIVIWLDRKHPWLKNPSKRVIYQLVFTVVYSTGIVAVVIVVLAVFRSDRTSSQMLFRHGVLMMKITLFFVILSMLITNAIIFFVNWKKSVVIQEQLKREQLSLQYETLKNQVNPHFLFNSLNSVTSLIKKDPDKAILFVQKLSEVLRYVLEQKDNEIVTVESELKFLESYIFLQKIRFGANLKVQIEVGNSNCYIIPLSLQMLIENAIKHNVVSREFPLSVTICSKDNDYLEVRNSLKKKKELKTSGIGIENIRSQFRFFTSKPVRVEQDEAYFIVELPLINAADLKDLPTTG